MSDLKYFQDMYQLGLKEIQESKKANMELAKKLFLVEKERDELRSKLDLIRTVAIPNSQGNCIVPTDLIYGEVK